MAQLPAKPASRAIREDLARSMRAGRRWGFFALLRSSSAARWGALIWLSFAALSSLMAILTRERPLVAEGRVATFTATVRVPFQQEDAAATQELRRAARARTPRVYVHESALTDLAFSLTNLPKTILGADSVDQIDPALREAYRLTDAQLVALRAEAAAGEPKPRWLERVAALIERLELTPVVDATTYQQETQSFNRSVELRGPASTHLAASSAVLNVENAEAVRKEMARLAKDAGFAEPLLGMVIVRLSAAPVPTYRFDSAATGAAQADAEAAVQTVTAQRAPGQVIFVRGDLLSQPAVDLYAAEQREFQAREDWRVGLRRVSISAGVLAITAALAGYAALFCPRIRRNASRTGAVAGLLTLCTASACAGSSAAPEFIALTSTAPTVFLAVILCIAYDQRVALAFAVLHGLLVGLCCDQSIGRMGVIITGVGAAVACLRVVRDRATLVRAGLISAAALAAATVLVGLIDKPISRASLTESLGDAALAGFGGLMVAATVVFVLPTIERVFGLTTSMTLMELRDPKQPLLRELQRLAPGTYTHSLNVAGLAEAAADAIGANGLLAYAGALYHDVGKINKPEYFVENQPPGFNRHDKLTPALSLLVIIGHVKDGVEMARQFRIPRALIQFIESHHGTTLVEYFFRQARKRAELESADVEISELEYRYPGPKPRSREAACLMICDASESAARSLADPTPPKLEALVRAIATKRLLDGQFDECDLTLKELNTIADTVSKGLASLYHSRIAYDEPDRAEPPPSSSSQPAAPGLTLTRPAM